MRLFWVIGIDEFDTSFCGARLSNRFLCALLGGFQLLVVICSFLQHMWSFKEYRHIFNCHSDINIANSTWSQQFLAYDIIIFDFGLMHRILGTTECIANYLDGGYMRCAWCVEQASALVLLIIVLFCIPKPVWLLWPALLMQSSYVLGMAILTMATAPKLLEAFSGHVDQELGIAIFVYVTGVSLNWLFTFILWHYYWGMEQKYSPPRIVIPADL